MNPELSIALQLQRKELNIPEAELNEAIAIAMTVGASKVRALADKVYSPQPVPAERHFEEPVSDCKT